MKTHTSLELSKKLAEGGCDLGSKYLVRPNIYKDRNAVYFERGILTLKERRAAYSTKECYLAYDLLWDVCVKYADKFFGNELNYRSKRVLHPRGTNCQYFPKEIFKLLQQNKTQEAEDYIWENCLFNPKNRKEKNV